MPFNPLPQSWLPSLTDNGTVLSLDIADVPELAVTEIDSATGDIRKFIFALCEKFWSKWSALATADRSTKMLLTKSSSVNVSTGIITSVYTFTFQNAITAMDVADEA